MTWKIQFEQDMLLDELAMEAMFIQESASSSDSTVVLTTHERLAYFSAAFQGDVDARFNPKKDPDLEDLLHNVIVAGGKTVVIDEDYFMNHDDLVQGLERFADTEEYKDRLDVIVVCSRRSAGDSFLAFLVMYCGIYNIIFGKQGADITLSLCSLLKRKQSRCDARELVAGFRWPSFCRGKRDDERGCTEYPRLPAFQPYADDGYEEPQIRESHEFVVDVENGGKISVQFEIRTIGIN